MFIPTRLFIHAFAFLLLITATSSAAIFEVELAEADSKTVAEMLRIRSKSAAFKASKDASTIRMIVDIYRNGKPIRSIELPATSTAFKREEKSNCSLTLADLDYIDLAAAKRNHMRFHLRVSHGETVETLEKDLPNSIFSCEDGFSTGRLKEDRLGDEHYHLFYMIGDAKKPNAKEATNIEELLQLNPEACIVAVSVIARKDRAAATDAAQTPATDPNNKPK